MELELCDRNRNFDAILDSIIKVIEQRDGVDKFKLLEVGGKY